jgi:hypothetical protein
VDDVELVQMLDGQHDLCQVVSRLVLLEIDLIVKHSPQVTSRQVLQHEHVRFPFREGKGRSHQVVSSNALEYLVLVLHCLQLLPVVALESHHLQGIQVARLATTHQVHLPECALTQELQQFEI